MSENEVHCTNVNESFLEAVYNGAINLKVSPHETNSEKNYAQFYTVLKQKFSLLSHLLTQQLAGLWSVFFYGNDLILKVICSISIINIV